MRRYRAKLAGKRKKSHVEDLLKLKEIRKHSGETSDIEVVDINPGNRSGLNHENASSESCESDGSEIQLFGNNRRALSLGDVDFLINKLRSWFKRHKSSHRCLSDLLKILKLWFVELPTHPRSVLGSKTDFNIQNIAGGEYIHISIKLTLPIIALKHTSVICDS